MKGIWIGIIAILVILAVIFFLSRTPEATTLSPQAIGTPVSSPVSTRVGGETPTAPPQVPVSAETGIPAEPTATSVTVTIGALAFTPSSAVVAAGGSVTFVNADTVGHQVASDPHPIHTKYPPLNGGTTTPGGSRNVTFTQAGTFTYHDHLNPSVTGTVIVR